MAFPITHLIIAKKMLEDNHIQDAESFLLGSIAPDAVHFRESFVGASMATIGQAKKITHLCPVSDEKWGSVTDNDGWLSLVQTFLSQDAKTAFRLGYATHVLTDIYNNKTIWKDFWTNHPIEAKKGYKSAYYEDLKIIDALLNENRPVMLDICETLSSAKPDRIDGLVSPGEVEAIKQSIILQYGQSSQTSKYDKKYSFSFVSYDEMLIFVKAAALFCSAIVF